jgi:hypothetical protein
MTQKLIIGNLKGSGIVGVLVVVGLISYFVIDSTLGKIAISSAIVLAIIYGFLGALGIVKKVLG